MSDPENEYPSALEVISDAVGDAVTGIPASIRKSLLKAIGALCSETINYPTTLLVNARKEREAKSQARIRIIESSARQISTELNVSPDIIVAAASKFTQRIIQEQINKDNIVRKSLEILKPDFLSAPEEDIPFARENGAASPITISEDWLNFFEQEAKNMSSERMQIIFGKLLAGEILKPGSFSIKTVKLISQLDNEAAISFRRLCSLAFALTLAGGKGAYDARVIAVFGNAAANSLAQFGLNFDKLNLLHEYGLIISDYNSYMDYSYCVVDQQAALMTFRYSSKSWILVRAGSAPTPGQPLNLHGVALSRSGRELLPIVDVESVPEFEQAVGSFLLQQHGLSLTLVK